jgi:hypothetical protein
MRKTIVFLMLFVVMVSYAQSPEQFKYQAIIRNADGTIKANKDVVIDIALLKGSATGTEIMKESHSVTTNNYGLVTLKFNSDSLPAFSSIDWSDGSYYLQVTMDGELMGATELLSVPYSLYTNKAESYQENDPMFSESFISKITTQHTKRWDNYNSIPSYSSEEIIALDSYEGLAVFNTDENKLLIYAKGTWKARQLNSLPE